MTASPPTRHKTRTASVQRALGGVPAGRVALIARRLTPTNNALLRTLRRQGAHALIIDPEQAERLRPGDAAIARLDVLPTLDGVEPGLSQLRRLEERGVVLLNTPGALLTCHDKLATALRLAQAGVPHPRTALVDSESSLDGFGGPMVVKPRFGSWGADVVLCHDRSELERELRHIADRPWFIRQGALVQEFVPNRGHDLRLVVASGHVIGAVERHAAPGEWRTNVSLGATRRPIVPPPDAAAAAVAAARATGADLVGVDLLPTSSGFVVLELNGAVDFTAAYSLNGTDVFEDAVDRLAPAMALAHGASRHFGLIGPVAPAACGAAGETFSDG